jgi:hypothetical protein
LLASQPNKHAPFKLISHRDLPGRHSPSMHTQGSKLQDATYGLQACCLLHEQVAAQLLDALDRTQEAVWL